jgi:ferredoxin
LTSFDIVFSTEEVTVKVIVDRVKCTGLGLCEAAAPESFEIDDEGALVVLTEDVPAELLDSVRAAVEACPTLALKLT